MSQFSTPLKQNNQNTLTQNKVMTQPRKGDWVCYSCNNLNFSFRKKCNRCKVQTRQQNQHVSQYYYNYFPTQYYYQEKQNFPGLQNEKHLSQYKVNSNKNEFESIQTNSRLQLTPKRQKNNEQLPSVSPLVKRYNRHQNNSTQESKSKGLFQDECLWANINIKYLDEPMKGEQMNELGVESEEIQRIIQRIML